MSEDVSFYREILDGLFDGVYFVDRDRVVTFWNRGAARISGYGRSRCSATRAATIS